MNNLLHIDASARPGLGGIDQHGSYSRRLSGMFVDRWKSLQPDVQVRHRDIGQRPPPHVDLRWIEAAFNEARVTEGVSDALEISDELIEELLWADIIVIGVPMYNFGMPSALKAWLDQIVRINRTVFYDPTVAGFPYAGVFANKSVPVVTLSSRGDYGLNPAGEYAHMNHLEPALETALGFIGLRDFHSVAIEHQSEGGKILEVSINKAFEDTLRLAEDLHTKMDS